MPDINGASRAGEFWIELKVCKTNKYSTAGLWRPLQVSWQMARAKVFPNVWNVVSHPAADAVYVYRCDKVFRLSAGDDTAKPDLILYGPVEWANLLELVRDGLTKREDMD